MLIFIHQIVDIRTGKSFGANQDGELLLRGPSIMKGYYKNPKATAQTIENDGWLHTGKLKPKCL